ALGRVGGAEVGEELVFAAGEQLGPRGEAGEHRADLLDHRRIARALVADEAGDGAAAMGMTPGHPRARAHRFGFGGRVDDGASLEPPGRYHDRLPFECSVPTLLHACVQVRDPEIEDSAHLLNQRMLRKSSTSDFLYPLEIKY